MINFPQNIGGLLQQWGAYLFPRAAEQDSGFRTEVCRSARVGLLVIGGVQIGVSLFMLASRFLIAPEASTLTLRLTQGAVIITCGVLTILCSRIRAWQQWYRSIGLMSSLLSGAVLIPASLLAAARSESPGDFIPGQITLVMLLVVTVIPLKPWQTFALGTALGICYVVSATLFAPQVGSSYGPDGNYLLFIVMLTLLCTGITTVAYQQRQSNYELRQSQTRMLLAENASSLARLAAALSHELNNPMGALLSGIDTLLLLTSRQATCTPEEQPRLVLVQADVRKSIKESAARLKKVVARMQRFTNLDQAEVQNVDLNELVSDVAALLQPQVPPSTKLEFELQPLKPVVCRPQQISSVLSNLMTNAVQAVNGEGGRVVVSTRQAEHEIEIEFRDNGPGVDPKHLEEIFEPTFRARGSRVRSGNWSMFSSRQIVREHGGEIHIASGPGQGTTVRVTLPVTAAIS